MSALTPADSADAKAAILGRIRSALRDVPREERPEDVEVTREYADSHVSGDAGAVVDLFVERVEDYRATVTRVTEAEAPAEIARILADKGIQSLVVPPAFPEVLLAGYQGSRLSDDPPLTPAELDASDGVITLAARGIALTGTIVLDAGPGQGRRALSLVPDLHLCVVRASQVAADVPPALRALTPDRPTTFISGPSATSDIELDRVEGVHGPRTLAVVLISD
ncbi:LUD domain-containing protein [Catenulispora sp. NL8]|uniref:LUD domain-containing protein n=1 Tax=Catenulispora pinistramenti TaxID=2705254 RepID=A0ABS5KQ99_9ACTN|nr:LUD domain-containing protein [Catenulispora pinistramenti]MBS2548209.1 LUD domain-containing protein [Catenulispora pinistramenti]